MEKQQLWEIKENFTHETEILILQTLHRTCRIWILLMGLIISAYFYL